MPLNECFFFIAFRILTKTTKKKAYKKLKH
jgi:hypothetical protein